VTSERIGTKTMRQSKGAQKRLEVRGAGGCVRSGSGLRERRVDGMTEGKSAGAARLPLRGGAAGPVRAARTHRFVACNDGPSPASKLRLSMPCATALAEMTALSLLVRLTSDV